ncbi:MAG: hypothetical protein JWN32_270 [Solirubrobacterales bacterium]|nr:hypothetical protein [Solirubrobacterales bacterium]
MSTPDVAALAPHDGAALAATVSEFVESALGRGSVVDARDMRKLVSAAARLYAACSDRACEEIPAIDATVSTTDAVMLASALLRAHDLCPFDLAPWFSRVGVGCSDRPQAES